MTISKELLDELLKGIERPKDLLGEAGLMKELKIKLMEGILGAELTAHLDYEEGKEAPAGQDNRRNGSSTKVLKGQDGESHRYDLRGFRLQEVGAVVLDAPELSGVGRRREVRSSKCRASWR
jgi:putative transposase